MPGKSSSMDVIELPPMDMRTYDVRIVGDSPLIVHRWSEKAKQEMRDKQMGKARAKKEPKVPEKEYEGARYILPSGKDGFPAVAFKKAAVSACSQVQGLTKVFMRSAFLALGEFVEIDGEPRMREDMVRVGMGTADLRYRPEYVDWATTLRIRFNRGVIGLEQVLHLLTLAGAGVGVGEKRPEKSGDSFGLFHVESTQEVTETATG